MCVSVVVSSDEEDGEIHQHHSPVFHPLVSQEETVTHKELTQETETKQQDISDTQDVEVGRNDVPVSYLTHTSGIQCNIIKQHDIVA